MLHGFQVPVCLFPLTGYLEILSKDERIILKIVCTAGCNVTITSSARDHSELKHLERMQTLLEFVSEDLSMQLDPSCELYTAWNIIMVDISNKRIRYF